MDSTDRAKLVLEICAQEILELPKSARKTLQYWIACQIDQAIKESVVEVTKPKGDGDAFEALDLFPKNMRSKH